MTGRALIGTAIVLFLGGWALYAPLLTEISYLNPPPAERELLQFLRTVPKDALIAGSPCALDSVQLFAERQVFFTFEQPPGVNARVRTRSGKVIISCLECKKFMRIPIK